MTEVDVVAIVGAGTMGRRIAFGCVTKGVTARLFDVDPAAADQATAAVTALIAERVADGRLPASHATASLTVCRDLAGCVHGAQLIIEAVPERLELKRAVFTQLAGCADAHALIATNTSSIPGSRLADATGRPERFINLNFGTPDDRKVEVMSHPGTSRDTLETVVGFLRRLDLVPIVARREIQGYPTNRVWRAVKREVLYLLDRGYSTPEDIDRAWMLDWGAPIGPCGLMDKVGLDVVRDIELVYYETTRDPADRPPSLLETMIEEGKLGEKTGQGFYTYPNPAFAQPGWLTGAA